MNKTHIIYFTLCATLLIAVVPVLTGSYSEDAIRWGIRRTVDIAFVLFFFSFGATAIHLIAKSRFSSWLTRNRRYLGISFGITFLAHASLILLLAQRYPEPFLSEINNAVITTGIVAFSLTALMTLSSNNAAMKLLGHKLWSSMHTLGGYYLLAMFCLTYLSKLDHVFFWPYAIAAVCLVLLRLYKIIKQLRNKVGTSVPVSQKT